MDTKKVDARGLSCPLPVILAKKGIEEISENSLMEILVDTDTAKENVARMATSLDCQVEVREDAEHNHYILTITRK